jgi:hypothetical protein
MAEDEHNGDAASINDEIRRVGALKFRKPVEPTLKPTGCCHNCEIETPNIYCSPECKEDHEIWMKLKKGV